MQRMILGAIIVVGLVVVIAISFRSSEEAPASREDTTSRESMLDGGSDTSAQPPTRSDALEGMPAANPTGAPVHPEDREAMVALARTMLQESIEENLPDYDLAQQELDQLADATLRMRDAQLALRALPDTPENADARRALVEEIDRASEAFAELMDLDPEAMAPSDESDE